jgi:hypothetical protein
MLMALIEFAQIAMENQKVELKTKSIIIVLFTIGRWTKLSFLPNLSMEKSQNLEFLGLDQKVYPTTLRDHLFLSISI